MIIFMLTINYRQSIPNKYNNLIEYFNNEKCVRCGQLYESGQCTSCNEFGIIYQNQVLYQVPYQDYPRLVDFNKPDICLTNLQNKASEFIIENDLKREILIWAVCGSGKTEITFEIIRKHINQQKFVAFVIPRKDILNEIAKRLEENFPGIDLVKMSSEHKTKRNGQLYVLTPNQLLRFKNAFSLIICDEVDAYPFMEDPRFIYAVETARRKASTTIFLTSTPSAEFLKRDLAIFTIYERWHKKLLPVPKLVYQNRFLFSHRLMRKAVKDILNNDRKCLLFVGNIKLGQKLLKRISSFGYNCEFVFAAHPKRSIIVEEFRHGTFDILITTTILERGVTFNGIDVIVFDSDSPSYNVAALVQIAGRVNRKLDDQAGSVLFCYEEMTKTIENACIMIDEMNRKNIENS